MVFKKWVKIYKPRLIMARVWYLENLKSPAFEKNRTKKWKQHAKLKIQTF